MSQAKRMRRVDLIDKKYKSILTPEESAELAELTAWVRANMTARSPMPKPTTPTAIAKRKRRAKGLGKPTIEVRSFRELKPFVFGEDLTTGEAT